MLALSVSSEIVKMCPASNKFLIGSIKTNLSPTSLEELKILKSSLFGCKFESSLRKLLKGRGIIIPQI